MDRIPDSGSDDMSSILIGCTNVRPTAFMLSAFFVKSEKVYSFVESIGYNLGISVFFFIFTELMITLKNVRIYIV